MSKKRAPKAIPVDREIVRAIETFRKAHFPKTIATAIEAFGLILKAYEAEEKRIS